MKARRKGVSKEGEVNKRMSRRETVKDLTHKVS